MKRIISLALKLFISFSLILYLFYFSGTVDVYEVIKTLKQTRLSFFMIVFFIYLITVLVSAKRWSLFLPETVRYPRLLSLYFIGSFFNTFLPGLVGGDAVKAFYLHRDIGKAGLSLATVFMDRYMGLIAMAGIAIIASIGGYNYIKGTEIVWFILVFLGALFLGSLIFWKINWGKIKFLSSFYAPLMEYKRKKQIIYKGLLLGFIVQFMFITGVYILSRSIGLDASIVYFFIFIPIISVASTIPVSVGGLGIRETGFVILFTKVGLTSAEALSLSLLVFTTMVLVNLIGGIEYLRIGKPAEKSRE